MTENSADTNIPEMNLEKNYTSKKVPVPEVPEKDKSTEKVKKELEKLKNFIIKKYPFTDIAIKLGNIKVANMAALGCYLRNKKTVALKNVLAVIKEMASKGKKDVLKINQQALQNLLVADV